MANVMQPDITHPKQLVEAGERIYREKFQESLERDQLGKFVTIDVKTGRAFLGGTATESLENAMKQAPGGAFHLMKIGSPGAFRVSYSNGGLDWVFR